MVEIVSSKQIVDSMRLAKETGTEVQLIHWLLYLDRWHSHSSTLVKVGADIPYDPAFISWYAYHIIDGKPQDECFYNGGLVYHESSKEWGVHS